jgi:3'(2'), 5'-bisphosphate nucleotidase
MDYATERHAAIDAVALACRLTRNVQCALTRDDTVTKQDRSPVTVADYGAQAVVHLALRAAFPDDVLLSEEETGYLRDPAHAAVAKRVVTEVNGVCNADLSLDAVLAAIDHRGAGKGSRFWALDPIDGTKGFLRGGQFAIALALIEDGQVVLGVLGCPNLPVESAHPASGTGCMFIAERGAGAHMRALGGSAERAITVSNESDQTAIVFCESVESAHTAHSWSGRVADALAVRAAPLRIDSQCKYAAVARGDATAYLRLPTRPDYEERLWDHAAGLIVVEEAGGCVTDITGAPLDLTAGPTLARNSGVVASNGKVHDALIAAIAATRSVPG